MSVTTLSPESQSSEDVLVYDGSSPLNDPKREAFARALFAGTEINDAYEEAGFRRPRGNAWRMYREPEVQARLAFLCRDLDATDLASRGWRRIELRRTLQAILTVDRTGMFEEVTFEKTIGRGRNARKVEMRMLQLKKRSSLTAEERLVFEGVGDGGRPVLPSKLAAAVQLAKLDGLDAATKLDVSEKKEITGDQALDRLIDGIAELTERMKSLDEANAS